MSHAMNGGNRASGAADSEHREPVVPPNNITTGKYQKGVDGGLPPDNFLPLVWGVDTLQISFKGEMLSEAKERLAKLKEYAQNPEKEHLAQASAGGFIFEVSDKGRRFYKYLLKNACFEIQLSDTEAGQIPVAYVKVRSQFLASHTPDKVLVALLQILEQFV